MTYRFHGWEICPVPIWPNTTAFSAIPPGGSHAAIRAKPRTEAEHLILTSSKWLPGAIAEAERQHDSTPARWTRERDGLRQQAEALKKALKTAPRVPSATGSGRMTEHPPPAGQPAT
jgi:hypothetical protein